ncbi:hypothetical protein C0989_008276 [Termitomyces sp. Mn162]|nr:hypothetical protein C0989_008276 [Termitomyces sp. Mn162]
MLRLPWLQDINPDIDWKNLTMQFSGSKASLAAAIPLHLQSILDCNTPNPNSSTSRATQSPSTLNGSQENEDDMPLPWPSLSKSQWLPPNISQNQYKDPAAATPLPTPVDPRDLDIKIIGTIPFACILQDGTPAFQLQIMPALPEEYLYAETILLEHKTEEQILYEGVQKNFLHTAPTITKLISKKAPHTSIWQNLQHVQDQTLSPEELPQQHAQQRFHMLIDLCWQHSGPVCQEEGQITPTLC